MKQKIKTQHGTIIGLVVLLAMGICFLGCANSAAVPEWQEQYDLGIRYLSEGNYEEAILMFSAVIEIDPKQIPAYTGRAEAYIKSGATGENYRKALADYETVLSLDEKNVAVWVNMANLYEQLGEPEKALEVLQKALTETKNDPYITMCLEKLGEKVSEEGERLINGEDAGEPTDAEPIKVLSVCYDKGQVGRIDGTPTVITIQYNCPEDKEYYFDVELWKGNQRVTLLDIDFSGLRKVSGSGTLEIETRLLLFDIKEDWFQIEVDLLEPTQEHESGAVSSLVYMHTYTIFDDFTGVSLPELPRYPGLAYEGGEDVLSDITVTGTIVLADDVFPTHRDLLCQYREYTGSFVSGMPPYLIAFDIPLVLPNGESIEYAFISMAVDFWSVPDNEDYIDNNLKNRVTLSGNLERQPGNMNGFVLVSSRSDDNNYMCEFKLPYTFVITNAG